MTEHAINIHPGRVLEEQFLKPLGITRYRLAKDIGVPQTRIAELCHCRRSISADTALRLAKYFNNAPKYWLGLQADYDLELAASASAQALEAIKPSPSAAAAPASAAAPAPAPVMAPATATVEERQFPSGPTTSNSRLTTARKPIMAKPETPLLPFLR